MANSLVSTIAPGGLNRQLCAWYLPLGGPNGVGTWWTDLVSGDRATLSNAPAWKMSPGAVDLKAYRAFEFDGASSQKASCSVPSGLHGAVRGSMSVVLRNLNTGTNYFPVVTGGGTGDLWAFTGLGYLGTFRTTRVDDITPIGGTEFRDWQHLVITTDGTDWVCYQNGQQIKTTTAQSTITCTELTLAYNAAWGNYPSSAIASVRLWAGRALSPSDVQSDYRHSLNAYRRLLLPPRRQTTFFGPSASTAYTLTGGVGSFTLSGQAATLRNARRVAADNATYTLSGQAAITRIARLLTSAASSYSLAGQDAVTRATRRVVAGDGVSEVFDVNSDDELSARLLATRRLTSDAGTYTLTGNVADLLRALRVAGAAGSFTLDGQDAGLTYSGSNPLLTAGVGGFTLSGQTANLLRGLRLAAETGTISLAGQDADTRRGLRLTIDAGTYTLSGIDANLAYGLGLIAGVGSFAVTGQDVGFRYNRRLTSALGTFTLTGQPATLDYSGASDPGVITFSGVDLSLTVTFSGVDLSQDITFTFGDY